MGAADAAEQSDNGVIESMAVNVIFGTGPLGLAVARRLASAGAQVRLVNRSGRAADARKGAEVVAADATDAASSRRACEGAAVVFHCVTGPYGRWAQFLPPLMNGIIAGVAAVKAKLVYGDNMYAYGPGIAGDDRLRRRHDSGGYQRAG
jgi:uncharacterized protein YbjT (DUF2867 family)